MSGGLGAPPGSPLHIKQGVYTRMATVATQAQEPFSQDPVFGNEVGGDPLLGDSEQDGEQVVGERVLSELADHVNKAWEAARQHRELDVTDRLLASQRQRQGIYSPEKAAVIDQYGGSKLFFNLTDTKCLAAEAWVNDFLARSPEGKTWDIEPTPIPDLPPGDRLEVISQVVDETKSSIEVGKVPSPEAVQTRALQIFDERLRALHEEARERMERMSLKIRDQLEEGGFTRAFREFVYYITTYPNGVLKGPIIRNKKRLRWTGSVVETVEEPIPTWEAINPHDFYPGPNARTVNESYICERIRWDRAELARMRGQDGWDVEAIGKALDEVPHMMAGELQGESDRASYEDRPAMGFDSDPDQPIEAVEYWGGVKGSALIEWGMVAGEGAPDLDEDAFYEVNVVKIGEHMVKAIMNPDVLGRRPYYTTSYEALAGQIWGRGIPEKMTDIQDVVNACSRNLVDNLAFAAGPMVQVDIDALDASVDPTKVIPRRVWQYHGSRARQQTGRDPVNFFQPSSNAQELLEVSEYYEAKADDRTLIPRFAHGNDTFEGAGQTASGLSMLMNSAARGLKNTLANIDSDIIRPLIERQYTWNLIYLNDSEFGALKGDARVVARGITQMLQQEQIQVRRQDFLDRTNNDFDMEIIGIEGRATVLRAVASDLDLPVDDVVPDDDVLREKAAQALVEQREMDQQEAEMGQVA